MNLKRIEDPVSLAIDLSEVKSHMRVDGTDEDTYITTLIRAATSLVEDYLERSLITQKWRKTWDGFPVFTRSSNDWFNGVREIPVSFESKTKNYLELNRGELISVEQLVTVDSGSNETVFSAANYYLNKNLRPRVILNDGSSWPVSLRDHDSVYVDYTAGYGATSSDIPQAIKTAIAIVVTALYENRCPEGAGNKEIAYLTMGMLGPYMIREL